MKTIANTITFIGKWNKKCQLKNKINRWLVKLLHTVLIIGICYIILYPLFVKFSSAFRHQQDLYDSSVVWIPRHFTLDNFKDAYKLLNYDRTLANSIILSLSSAILQVISCSLAGYGFARLKFKGSNLLFGLVIFTIVIPPETIMVPTYLHYRFFDVFGIYEFLTGNRGVNILESFWPFILSSATGMGMRSGLYIFIFRQFFKGIPKELEEAAYVDGAGVFTTFARVMLPNAFTAMITVFLFAFVWQWNDYYYANLYMKSVRVLSTQLAILPAMSRFVSEEPTYQSLIINGGLLLAIAPIFILYLFAQKYFVESIERTGLVG